MNVPVLYEDDFLLAVNKPSGLLVHRGWGRDKVVLTDIVKDILNVQVVHPLHRLDRQTSGVVLFAQDKNTAGLLRPQFENGGVQKKYRVLVRGVTPSRGIISHAIPRKENGPRVPAITAFSFLAKAQTSPRQVSWLEAAPQTGRLHQVRRHLKHINHPVIGDANYGKGAINREMAVNYGLNRMALHALSLTFVHPLSNQKIEITAPLPSDLTLPLLAMGFLDAQLK